MYNFTFGLYFIRNREENSPNADEIPKEDDIGFHDFNSDKYRKTLRLTSAQIVSTFYVNRLRVLDNLMK